MAGAAIAYQWSVYELSLTASGSYANPYTDVSVTARFTGPNNIVKAVRGFWDGGKNFKVRFTPNISGTWTYSITSTPPDSGLARSGALTVTLPPAGNHGFLRRDAANPYSFVWDDGTRYFMMGQTYYEIVRNARAAGGWRLAVDNSRSKGMNKIRMLIVPWPATENSYPNSQPFLSDNHDQLDIAHWQALDQVVEHLESKGMVADIVLFADTPLAYGTQTQDERFVRYALSRFGAYHNVIWNLTNEWNYTKKPQSYWNGIGGILKTEDPWMLQGSAHRPLSTHQQTRKDFQFFGQTWPSYASIQYGLRNGVYPNGDQWGNAGIVYNLGHGMPVVNDEYGYVGERPVSPLNVNYTQAQHRRVIWGIATAGGYGSAGDVRLISNTYPIFQSNWADAPGFYDDIKRLVDFWTTKGIQYWKMTSQNSLVSSGTRVYARGNAGQEYVAYAAAGGVFALNLPVKTYQVQWFNPATGAAINGANVPGGTVSFTPPFSGDAVLYLKNTEVAAGFGFTLSNGGNKSVTQGQSVSNPITHRRVTS